MPENLEQLCRLWLAFSEGVSPRVRQKLLELRGSYQALFDGFPASCEGLLSAKSIEELKRVKDFGLDRMLLRLEELGIAIAFRGDGQNYPELLSAIPNPPDLLFYKGRLAAEERAAVAIVGSRRETRYGRSQAHQIAHDLAQEGVTIVSGLARGIDTAAHLGALDGGGITWAVLGSGLSRIYPDANRPLAERIIASGGAIISELPPATLPLAYHFPVRNRIVSGLAQALLLVEAREKSGTQITVSHALDQGRDVFALPGEVDAPGSLIPHRMIREGARLCTCAADILEDMGWKAAQAEELREQTAMAVLALSAEAQAIMGALEAESLGFDELVAKTGLESDRLGAELTMLEMDGHILSLPGKQYRLNRR